MGILTDSFEDTVKRLYPGMELDRWVPCPTITDTGKTCAGAVKLENLERLLESYRAGKRKSSDWECPECGTEHALETLLVGLSRAPGHLELATKEIINAVRCDGDATREHIHVRMNQARLWMQDLFVSEWNLDQRNADVNCPTVFAFYPQGGKSLLYESEYVLQLYCMSPDGWHGVGRDGLVTFRPQKEWWNQTLGFIQKAAKWIRPVASLVPAIGEAAGEVLGEWAAGAKNHLELTAKLAEEWDKVEVPEAWKLVGENDHPGRARDWSTQDLLINLKLALSGLSFPVKPFGGLNPNAAIEWLNAVAAG